MKKIKISKADEDIFFSVLSTYPLMEEEEDKDAIKFNKNLERMKENIRKQMNWRSI